MDVNTTGAAASEPANGPASGPAADPFAVPPLIAPEAAADAAAGGRLGAAGLSSDRAAAVAEDVAGAEPPADERAEAAGEGTPGTLLAAGRKLFAEYGYDGASVRAITSAAGVNLGAITYHFGSKKALYNRVVELCVSPLVPRVEAALSRRGPVLDRLERVVRAYFDHFAENPDLPQLTLQEIVLGGAPPEAAGPFMRRIYALIVAAIREGQATGEVRPGDPTLMGMSLISQPIFPMLMRQPVEAITGLNMMEAGTRERVAAHVAAFARAGLAGPNGFAGSVGLAGATAGEGNGTLESTSAAAARRASADGDRSAEEAP